MQQPGVLKACTGLVSSSTVPEICQSLLKEFVDGLSWMHEKGLLYRGIKPANLIMITLNPLRGQLIDFDQGAKIATLTNKNIGTPG